MKDFADTLHDWGPLGALLLAALDSAGIPLPGGVVALIVAVAATNPGDAWLTAALAVAGSLGGSMFLFYLGRKGGQIYLDRHAVSRRARRFRAWFQEYGLVTVFVPALIPFPMPLKMFVLSAGATGVRPRLFFLVMLAGRVPNYFAMAWLGIQLGDDAMGWLKAHTWQLSAVGLGLMALLLFLLSRRKQSSTMTT